MGLLERFLQNPRTWRDASLALATRGGSTARLLATRELAERGRTDVLARLLDDPAPGVRRAAARGLGWCGVVDGLESRLASERSEVVRAALAGALGTVPEDAPKIGTFDGPRALPSCLERTTEAQREAGAARRDRLVAPIVDDGPAGRVALLAHAAACPPDLAGRLPALERGAGRRYGHAVIEAIGVLGDPRAAPRLVRALDGDDVDPGRGFRERRLAAVAFARLGDPAHGARLRRALDREVRDFEGRPGAGLGIQEPVRCALLWALGELGDLRAIDTLVPWLGRTDGHATHLWAMGALAKLGAAVLPALSRALAGDDTAAANAAGVIGALGPSTAADRALADPRPSVRAAAAHSLGRVPPEDPIARFVAACAAGDFHGAHDLLEPGWRASEGARREALQGLIQAAAALEHLRRGRPREAQGQWRKARARLLPLGATFEGVDVATWRAALDALDWDDPPPVAAWPLPTRRPR